MNPSRTRYFVSKLIVDGSMTVAVLMLLTIALTGIVVHEWLGIALSAVVTLHLLLNWAWIVAGVRHFFGSMPPLVRFNALLNALLFVLMTVVLASGVMISVVALRSLGLRMLPSIFLRLVHQVAADALLIVVGLHLGMNWRWVMKALRGLRALPARRASTHLTETESPHGSREQRA